MAQVPATSYESTSLGDVAEFTIPFPFLSRAEVFVTVDGAQSAFTWINDGLIQLPEIPELGAIVRRYRSTAAYVPLHQFSQGVPFLPRYVDRDFTQTLYAVQESVNDTAGTAALALDTAELALDTAQDALTLVGERTQYMVLGAYGPGLHFQTTSQVFSYLGEFYAPGPSIVLPYTTTGAGAGEIANFRSVGDAILRSDLADDSAPSKGAAIISRGAQIVDSVAELRTLLKTSPSKYAFSTGYYSAGDGGGGEYFVDLSDTTTPDNGGTCIVAADGGRWKLVHAGTVSVKQFGARGNWNGTTGANDTTAIQAAADAGVRKITVPAVAAGFSYQTTAPINITKSVAFVGVGYETQTGAGALVNPRGAGSWIHLNHPGIGFYVKRATPGFQGVEFEKAGTFRSHTVTGVGAFVPTVYDFDFVVDDCADFKMTDFCMLNPYQGLLVLNGQQGRVWIKRLMGQPLFVGIRIRLAFDCVRIEDVQFWPYWSFHASVWAYMKLNTVGLHTWRADGLFVTNYFSIFHRIGWQVSGDVTNGTTFKARVTNMFLDNCAYGYFVDTSARGHTSSIVNLSIQMDPAVVDTGAKPVLIVPDSCDIDIVNLDIRLSIAEAVHVAGPYVRLNLHNLKVYDWAKGVAAAAVICGDVNSVIEVTGRKIFDLGGVNQIYAGTGKIVADVAAGRFSGTTNPSGDVVIPHNGRMTTNTQKIQVKSFASLIPVCTATGLNTITVRVYNSSTGAGLANTAVSLDWQVGMS